jgi:hypothetical protein
MKTTLHGIISGILAVIFACPFLLVGDGVNVSVGVGVDVGDGEFVQVGVGVSVDVDVQVEVGVSVEVIVAVLVGVGVAVVNKDLLELQPKIVGQIKIITMNFVTKEVLNIL